MRRAIETARRELGDAFCRACGYCLPCPVEIPIPMADRMSLLLTRMPWQTWVEPAWRDKMDRIEQCTGCGQCISRCPYGLEIPSLLKAELDDYRKFLHSKESNAGNPGGIRQTVSQTPAGGA